MNTHISEEGRRLIQDGVLYVQQYVRHMQIQWSLIITNLRERLKEFFMKEIHYYEKCIFNTHTMHFKSK